MHGHILSHHRQTRSRLSVIEQTYPRADIFDVHGGGEMKVIITQAKFVRVENGIFRHSGLIWIWGLDLELATV